MRAMVLEKVGPIDSNPLIEKEVPIPELNENEILIRIKTCGICRTDLHIIEGEIPTKKLPLIPGHQIVGVVEKVGDRVSIHKKGDRVGVTWLYWTCGTCKYCKRGLENLCEKALFTGYSVDGGYAEYIKVHERYAFNIPENYSDVEAAPLLCAGVIGYRAFSLCKLKERSKLGLYGFGSSAHIVLQIAKLFEHEVYVFTRSYEHQRLAEELGAVWVGSPKDRPNTKLDAAIIFAPAGWIVKEALRVLDKGGRLVLAGIYMSPIPQLEYELLYYEKEIKSVANCTRKDIIEFLRIASKAKLKIKTQTFKLSEANEALKMLKYKGLKASGVLVIG